MKRNIFMRTLIAGCLSVVAIPAMSQPGSDYPNRPIRLVVPVAAGGLTDIFARMVAAGLQERLGQPVIVDNKPGSAGFIAMAFAARAPADGYTLVMGYPGALAVNQSLYKSMPYDPMADFVPISLLAAWPMVMLTKPSLPVESIAQLVALAKQQPNKLNYGTGGNATTVHLAMELFSHAAGIRMTHVPYRSSAPQMADLIAGQIDLGFDSLAVALPQIAAGKVRVLGIASLERSSLAPTVPTIAESGYPNFEVTGWYGMVAPAGTPAPIVARLSRELIALVQEPAMRTQMAERGIEPIGRDSTYFKNFIASEVDKWRQLIRVAKIQAE